MKDVTETLCGAKIYHGKHNDRIYVLDMRDAKPEPLLEALDELAGKRGYSKISVRVPAPAVDDFRKHGYMEEASIPGFYNRLTDISYMAFFPVKDRAIVDDRQRISDVLGACEQKRSEKPPEKLPEPFAFARALEEDADELAGLYADVFETYPFPIQDPDYVKYTMEHDVLYGVVRHEDRIVAASSAEMDPSGANAEMTDFATNPDYRGRGLAGFLLQRMEKEAFACGIRTAYTIARAVSYGMNITFARGDYTFAGTLINNTNISGSTECMNIWYKALKH